MKPPLDPHSEVVDQRRRWTPDWYGWLQELTSGGTVVTSFNARTGAVTLQASDVTGVGGALLASPVFTGDPQAPTPAATDNDTSIATTAFFWAALAAHSYINVAAPPYNAVGDGTTDNTSAINSALAALGSRGGTLYFPAGKYRFNSLITFTYPLNGIYDLSITGDGQDSTILFWPSGVSGLKVNFNSNTSTATQSFHIRDLSITTGDTPGSGRVGLNLNQSGALVGAYVSYSEITRVVFRGDDGVVSTDGWAVACSITDVSNVRFDGCSLHGTASSTGEGVSWSGGSLSALPTGLYFSDCAINSFNIGVQMNDFTQGLYFTTCQINGCIVGINLAGGASATDAAVGIINSEFGVYNSNANAIVMGTNPVAQLQIDNCNFNMSQISGPSGFIALATSKTVQIVNCFMVAPLWPGSGTIGTKLTGISISGSVATTCTIIANNTIGGFFGNGTGVNSSAPIILGSGANRVLVTGNSFIANQFVGATTSCINNQGTNVIISNNQYDSGFGPTFDAFVGDQLAIKSDKTSTVIGDIASAFGVNLGNQNNASGSHGVAIFSGASATNDAGTVCIDFLDASANLCGSITRNDTGSARGISFNGNGIQVTGGIAACRIQGNTAGQFQLNVGNGHNSAGDHGVVVFAGNSSTNDTTTEFVRFSDPSLNSCGSITRNDTGSAKGVQYNGISLNIQGGVTASNLFGSLSSAFQLNMGNKGGASGDHAANVFAGDNTTSDVTSVFFNLLTANGTQCGAVVRNDAGGIRHVIYGTSSDGRLKENIQQTERGLRDLNRLRVIDYGPSTARAQALVAQEVLEIYPEAVHRGGEDPQVDPWSMDYGRITPLLIQAIKDLSAKVDRLEKEMNNGTV